MNVGELKKMLEKYPDDMPIIHGMYSDFESVKEDDWFVQRAVNKGFYVMRSHPTMSEENKASEQDFLALRGN